MLKRCSLLGPQISCSCPIIWASAMHEVAPCQCTSGLVQLPQKLQSHMTLPGIWLPHVGGCQHPWVAAPVDICGGCPATVRSGRLPA